MSRPAKRARLLQGPIFRPEQCARALKAANYEVAEAVQRLKIEWLLESGLCSERTHAERTLSATKWNLNDAAIRLVS